jgi:hypothetical protein
MKMQKTKLIYGIPSMVMGISGLPGSGWQFTYFGYRQKYQSTAFLHRQKQLNHEPYAYAE